MIGLCHSMNSEYVTYFSKKRRRKGFDSANRCGTAVVSLHLFYQHMTKVEGTQTGAFHFFACSDWISGAGRHGLNAGHLEEPAVFCLSCLENCVRAVIFRRIWKFLRKKVARTERKGYNIFGKVYVFWGWDIVPGRRQSSSSYAWGGGHRLRCAAQGIWAGPGILSAQAVCGEYGGNGAHG